MVDNSNEENNLKIAGIRALNEYVEYCKGEFSDNMILGTISAMNTLVATFIAVTNSWSGAGLFLAGLNLVLAITRYVSARRFNGAMKETKEEIEEKEKEEKEKEELRVK